MKIEEKVPYIVRIKEKYIVEMMLSPTGMEFCGFLVNNANGSFYFTLNGSGMLVVIPHYFVETMYPSKKHLLLLEEEERWKI